MASTRVPAEMRSVVEGRAGGCCEYCRAQSVLSGDPFPIDHILPVVRGGPTTPDNLALSCYTCNSRKYAAVDAVYPVTGSLARLFNPRTDKWADHFAWSVDALLAFPLTPIGRATHARLDLNRPRLIEHRRELKNLGRHPPP